MVTTFRGEYHFLSNFYLTQVFFRGVWYRSSEHAYMSAKSDDPQWKVYCANQNVTPADVKENCKYIKLIDNWHVIKLSVMEECLRSKFSDTIMREKLLGTGSQNLQEGNWWGDRFWGVDLTVNPNIGENHLGRLLMKIRDELKLN